MSNYRPPEVKEYGKLNDLTGEAYGGHWVWDLILGILSKKKEMYNDGPS